MEYELASEVDGEQWIRPGVVCANMAPAPQSLLLGNELLLALDPKYPREQRFKVKRHTVQAVVEIATELLPPADGWMSNSPASIQSALDVFAGYVMLDAWIANQDRHHENWGAIRDGSRVRLAPTFDHGAALARNLLDSERAERLTTRDQNRMVPAFTQRGHSAFYGSAADARPLKLREAFLAFAQRVPAAANAWLVQLRAVNRDAVWGILERVPVDRMSDTCKRFTMELLLTNQQRLLQ